MYDIYGKEGLVAGLQVGPSQRSTDELRQDWERFKAQQVQYVIAVMHQIEKSDNGCYMLPSLPRALHHEHRLHGMSSQPGLLHLVAYAVNCWEPREILGPLAALWSPCRGAPRVPM